MKNYVLCLIFMLASGSIFAQEVLELGSLHDPDLKDKITTQIEKYTGLDIFSGVVLMAEEGRPVYHKAFGEANREKGIKNSLNTLFNIGSMNKTFTSTVIYQLVEKGAIRLDDRLIDYITGFRDPRVKKVTISHLLNHSSGFGDYFFEGFIEAPINEKTLGSLTKKAKNDRLLFEPGTGNEYSNTGYVLLGAVIEKVTGRPYPDNVRSRILEPLGLRNTFVENLESVRGRQAMGYLRTPMGELEVNDGSWELPGPSGGFLSTTEDILRFYHSLFYKDELISTDMKSRIPFHRMIHEAPAGQPVMMAGGLEGYNSVIAHFMEEDITLIIFANMDEPVAELLSRDILQILQGKTPGEPDLPAVQRVRIAFEEHGTGYVKKHFEELTDNFHPADPKDMILNMLGYGYLYGRGDAEKAIELFTLNTELFPGIANTWDSLGQAWREKGNKEKALKYYRKALEIRPGFPSAKKAVEELEKK